MKVYEVQIKGKTQGFYKNLETAKKVIENYYGSFINSTKILFTQQNIDGYFGYFYTNLSVKSKKGGAAIIIRPIIED